MLRIILVYLFLVSASVLQAQDVQEFAGLAHNAMERGEMEKAAELYSKAISLDNSYYLYYFNRSICYLKLKDVERSLADLDTSIRLEPRNSSAWFQQAVVLAQSRRYREAAESLTHLIAIDSTNGRAYVLRGRVRIDSELQVKFKQADSSFTLSNQGVVDKSVYEFACDDFRTALAMGDNTAQKFITQYCLEE